MLAMIAMLYQYLCNMLCSVTTRNIQNLNKLPTATCCSHFLLFHCYALVWMSICHNYLFDVVVYILPKFYPPSFYILLVLHSFSHVNILPLMGFCLQPPMLILPFMERGSLHAGLHVHKVMDCDMWCTDLRTHIIIIITTGLEGRLEAEYS